MPIALRLERPHRKIATFWVGEREARDACAPPRNAPPGVQAERGIGLLTPPNRAADPGAWRKLWVRPSHFAFRRVIRAHASCGERSLVQSGTAEASSATGAGASRGKHMAGQASPSRPITPRKAVAAVAVL